MNYRTILTRFILGGLLGLCLVSSAQAEEVPTDGPSRAQATFAGGCFWCVESDFDKVDGVISTTSGYTGGEVKDPTYREVSAGGTGHYEAVRVVYDPEQVSYQELVDYFWRHIDPLDDKGQFCDKGSSYRSAIFYHNDQQEQIADRSKVELEDSERFDQPIVTEILPVQAFYEAEEYHQDYYQKNPLRYQLYRTACGRDRRVKALWSTDE